MINAQYRFAIVLLDRKFIARDNLKRASTHKKITRLIKEQYYLSKLTPACQPTLIDCSIRYQGESCRQGRPSINNI